MDQATCEIQDLRPWCQHTDATSATSQRITDSDTPEKQIYDVLNYKEKPEMIFYYTGFSSYDHFM